MKESLKQISSLIERFERNIEAYRVLIVVFSSQFFGPLAPTLSAFYMLPFFVMIVPARMAGNLVK